MMRFATLSLALAIAVSGSPLLPTRTEPRSPVTLPLTVRTNGGPGDIKQFGDNYGITVSVGTPPQELWLELDAGSGDIVVLGDNCSECNSASPLFSPSNSSTYKSRDTVVTTTANNGSATGTLSFDTIGFGGFSLPNQPFINACKGNGAGSLAPGLSGVLGLGWPDGGVVSTALGNSFLPTAAQTLAFTQWAAPQYGLYLGDDCGYITFGGVDESKFEGEITYTPTIGQGRCQNSNWTIGIEMILVNGKTVTETTPACEPAKPQPSPINKRQNINYGWFGESTIVSTLYPWTSLFTRDFRRFMEAISGAQPDFMHPRGYKRHSTGSKTDDYEYYLVPCNTTATVSLVIAGMRYDFPSSVLVGEAVEEAPGMCRSLITGQKCGTTTVTSTTTTETKTVRTQQQLGLNFLKHMYTSFNYDPPSVGFARLK